MTMQQPGNPGEITAHLNAIEQRLLALEEENRQLRQLALARRGGVDKHAIAGYVALALPRTNLLSASFFKRAFAVWGHFFVANLIVGLISSLAIGLLYGCIVIGLLGLVLGSPDW